MQVENWRSTMYWRLYIYLYKKKILKFELVGIQCEAQEEVGIWYEAR